jgi:hypothetical protein
MLLDMTVTAGSSTLLLVAVRLGPRHPSSCEPKNLCTALETVQASMADSEYGGVGTKLRLFDRFRYAMAQYAADWGFPSSSQCPDIVLWRMHEPGEKSVIAPKSPRFAAMHASDGYECDACEALGLPLPPLLRDDPVLLFDTAVAGPALHRARVRHMKKWDGMDEAVEQARRAFVAAAANRSGPWTEAVQEARAALAADLDTSFTRRPRSGFLCF